MASTKLINRVAAREIDARSEIARQDLATAMAEIFTPRVRGRRQVVEAGRVYNGVTVRITGPELDATDLGVLLALHVIASRNVSDVAPCVARAGLLPIERKPENVAGDLNSLAVQTTVAEVAELIGRDPRDGRAAVAIRRSLRYLMMVVVEGERDGSWGANHLVSAAVNRGGALAVSLNYRATRAVMGAGQWAAVDMARFRDATGIERVLMHRLAAHCTGGVPMPVGLDRLAAVCWTRPPKSDDDARKRRTRIRAALPRVLPTGITAVMDRHGLVTFKRGTRNTQGSTK